MPATSSGGLGKPLGRTLPDWADLSNDFGETTILQMTATSNEHPLPKNPFIIGKSVESAAGVIEGGGSENKGESYILYVKNPGQVQKLKNLKKLVDDTPISIKPHPRLNVSRCIISSKEALENTEEDVLENLKNIGVIEVRRIKRNLNGEKKNTPMLILTFGKTTFPEWVKIGITREKTRMYYPNPMLCFACYEYGHTKIRCSKPKRCYNCSQADHGEKCEKPAHCSNCDGNHRPSSRQCEAYQFEEQVIKAKIDHNLSYPEARNRVEAGGKSYAHTTAQSRLDQSRLAALEKSIQYKDEQIAKLLEATKLKDSHIAKLEQQMSEMKNYMQTEMQKQQLKLKETLKNEAKAKDSKKEKDKVNPNEGTEHKTERRTKRSGEKSTPNDPDRNRSPPLKVILTEDEITNADQEMLYSEEDIVKHTQGPTVANTELDSFERFMQSQQSNDM